MKMKRPSGAALYDTIPWLPLLLRRYSPGRPGAGSADWGRTERSPIAVPAKRPRLFSCVMNGPARFVLNSTVPSSAIWGRSGADPNVVDREGRTALIKAALKGYPDIVQIMIRYGAEVNARSAAGETALMLAAARCEHVQIVKDLLRAGARTDLKNNAGETALRLARKALADTARQPYVAKWEQVVRRRRRRCAEIIRLLEEAAAKERRLGSDPPG